MILSTLFSNEDGIKHSKVRDFIHMKPSDISDDSLDQLGRVIAFSRPSSFNETSNVAPKYLVFKYDRRYPCAISQIPEPCSCGVSIVHRQSNSKVLPANGSFEITVQRKTGRKGKSAEEPHVTDIFLTVFPLG